MKQVFLWLVRACVGLVFVFSGFVKLVDPQGSAYKFEEYFGADVLQLEWLIPYALPLSILLILMEVLLGVMLLVGHWPKQTVWSLLGMILLFLFLTWYAAYYNKVTDCGCFGDAIKLSAWETFYKNVVLILLIAVLVWNRHLMKPLVSSKMAQGLTVVATVVLTAIMYYSLAHLPVIDFRPFAVGNHIPQGMEYKGDQLPTIHDFYLETVDGKDMTDILMAEERLLLIVAYDLGKSDREGFTSLEETVSVALKQGYRVAILSASLYEAHPFIGDRFGADADLLFCDATTLKTMIRANPGVMTLHKGSITGKWNWIDIANINW